MIMQVNAKIIEYAKDAKDEYERMQISANEYITAYNSKQRSKMTPISITYSNILYQNQSQKICNIRLIFRKNYHFMGWYIDGHMYHILIIDGIYQKIRCSPEDISRLVLQHDSVRYTYPIYYFPFFLPLCLLILSIYCLRLIYKKAAFVFS